jgi:hypothetical protein
MKLALSPLLLVVEAKSNRELANRYYKVER